MMMIVAIVPQLFGCFFRKQLMEMSNLSCPEIGLATR